MQALVVNLSSDHASGDKVTFYRQTELDLLSAASKARLKDVVSPVEDDVVSLEGAHKETLVFDKLVRYKICKLIFWWLVSVSRIGLVTFLSLVANNLFQNYSSTKNFFVQNVHL